MLQVWTDSGDCEFPQRLDEFCVDDSPEPACDNGCSFRGSSVTINASAGTTYLFEVGAYNHNSAGCTLCLGVKLIICGGDASPPITAITSPGALGCSCEVEQIVGSAYDPDGTFSDYPLEYRPATGGAWEQIDAGTNQIIDGVIGTWNTAALAQGYYYLRLTARNACGLVNTAMQVAWVDNRFDSLDFRSPPPGAILGRSVCLDGTVWDNICFDHYTAEYRPAGGGGFAPVDPSQPFYTNAVINDPFANWDTLDLGLPDGDYELRVTGVTDCGFAAGDSRNVTVDNTAPTAEINSPINCAQVDGMVQIVGTANDANLSSWVLQYAIGNANTWTTIASGASPIVNGLLANWDTGALPVCAYALRLIVADQALLDCNGAIRHRSEYVTLIEVGNTVCDINGDAVINAFDIEPFLNCLFP